MSDLHLGTRTRIDLLRREGPQEALSKALAGVDQLVLLGDAIELRDGPIAEALAAARAFLESVGSAMRGGRVVIVPGNHDHRLASEALELGRRERRRALSLVHEVQPGRSGALAAIRDVLGTEVLVAYPGFWISEGIWATHGHYLDAHSAAPTLECAATALLAIAQSGRRGHYGPGNYEDVLWPTYELFYAIAQRRRLQRVADGGKRVVRAVEGLLGTRGPRSDGRSSRRAARAAALPLRIGGARLALAPGELRRPGILPFGRVLERLGVEADGVLFGHTHRTGPVAGDDPAVWHTSAGTALYNTGSWVDEPAYHGGRADSPYWPGTLTLIHDGTPQVTRVLGGPDKASSLSGLRALASDLSDRACKG